MTEREAEISSTLPHDLDALPRLQGFRLRGLEMTRLEAFVDATFAFAVTMLVIAGQQVPDDVSQLLAAFKNVPGFAASIMVLAIFWRGHWLWSRRYGLEDNFSIMISWALIFTMLIYVYPLKVIFGGMFAALSQGRVGGAITVGSAGEARAVFAIFAIGFTAIALEMITLYLRAWRLRDALRLDPRERFLTRAAIGGWSVPAGVGIVSLVLALTMPLGYIAWSGWVYYAMIVLVPLHKRWTARRAAALTHLS